MKWPEPENLILVLCVIAFIALILLVTLGGCTLKKVRGSKILWHSSGEDCVLFIEGISAEEGKDLSDNLDVENCTIKINDEGVKK
jgi:hypothetical protein